MCLIEKGISVEEATRTGGEVVVVQIINIFKEMIGIGRPKNPSESSGQIINTLQERAETIHYHITTQFWVLTGTYRSIVLFYSVRPDATVKLCLGGDRLIMCLNPNTLFANEKVRPCTVALPCTFAL